MEATSPSGPMVSWEKPEPPERSKYAEDPIEMTRVELLNDSWIPVYARHSVEFIHDFATDPSKFQEEEQKEEFLRSIFYLCIDALLHDFYEDLNDFCTKYKLVEITELLLNSEPRDEICSRLRRRAMMAFAALSCIGASLDIKKILRLCFNSVFFLRPRSAMPKHEATLCTRALLDMDTMLQVIVQYSPGTNNCEMLQDMFELLLDYLFCDIAVVQDRAIERIKMLCHLLVGSAPKEDDEDEDDEDKDDEDKDDEDEDDEDEDDDDAPRAPVQIPVLGKLVGHLFFKLFKPQEDISMVVEILCPLMAFLFEQKCNMSESDVEPPEQWESEITSWVNASSTWKVQAFGRYLGPDERTGVVLEAIEILGRSNLMNKDGPREFLEEAMNSPEMWLTDVPKVVRHIFRYFNEKNAATADSFHSLLVFMANKWPERVISTALKATPNFSDKLSLWKAMFSVRQTLEKVLKELQVQVQDRQDDTFTRQQKSFLTFLSAFGRYLGPDERTGVVLEAIEILGRSNLMNKDGLREFLEEAMNSPEMWLTDVPKVVRHIFRYFNEKNAATADSFHSLLVFMANKWPERVISTALEATPNFSDKLSLWKAMFSVRQTLEKVLKELQVQVQDRQDDTFTRQQKSCLTFLSMLAYGDVLESRISPLYENLSLLKSPKMEMIPLVLRALETLSESAKTAQKMKSLLPEMLEFLGHWSWDISVMALDTFRNVLGQLKKKEASSMALKTVQRLWSLFDANEECLRERSISLFRELLGKTAWRDKKAMRRNSWKALVQLVVHMSDQAPSVAKASKEAVVAVAELLKWKELKELAQKEQIWQMGECLLAKDSSRAEQFVLDCQPYLLSPQAPLREAALRFIGLAARRLTKRNEEIMAAILSQLGTVEARDKDPSIRALAAQTSLILNSLWDKRKPRLSLHRLCLWCH